MQLNQRLNDEHAGPKTVRLSLLILQLSKPTARRAAGTAKSNCISELLFINLDSSRQASTPECTHISVMPELDNEFIRITYIQTNMMYRNVSMNV